MKSKNMIKYVSMAAIIIVLLTVLWNIFRPDPAANAFLIMDKEKVAELGPVAIEEITNITVDDNYDPGNCSIKIDLSLLSPQTDIAISDWLKANKDNFCFPESYEFIEGNHKIETSNSAGISAIENGKKNTESLSDLVKLLPNLNPEYGSYINFTKQPDGTIVPSYKTSYLSGDLSLSVPTICSIIARNGITNNDDYTVTYSLFNHDKHIGLILTEIKNTANVKYYNYSTDPTKPTSVMFNPDFALY